MYQSRNIPIIMITRLQDMENMDMCIEPGVDDYLIKPINFRELRARINILLKKKLYMDTFYSNYEGALNPSIIDPLTGLYNHPYFKRFLELEVKRSLRHGYPVGLVMIGVDELDRYNDSYGRSTGDMILRELARVIKGNIREIDLAARYSDDEIAVILPYYNKDNALIVVERIRRAFASHSFQDNVPVKPADINLCMGIAFCMTDASTAEELILNAGNMLYLARKEKKNRVCVYR
ncbi:MAG: diguanylate cyclase [Deferribacteres bacterium]|nr:diguanylate cyclase [Deferribacteres bacterium]